MKSFTRSDRVGGEIQKILSEILRKDIKDPRLEMATITGVEVTKDLRIARIFFTVSGEADRVERAQQGFQSAVGFIKRTLASELGLRYMPDLKFFYDDSFDYGARIDALLKSIDTDHGTDNPPPEKE